MVAVVGLGAAVAVLVTEAVAAVGLGAAGAASGTGVVAVVVREEGEALGVVAVVGEARPAAVRPSSSSLTGTPEFSSHAGKKTPS